MSDFGIVSDLSVEDFDTWDSDPTEEDITRDCSSESPQMEYSGYYICTRDENHPGIHIGGTGSGVAAVWDNDGNMREHI